MTDFYINPLSVNEQCYSVAEILDLMNALVKCFEYLLPAINKERARLIFDSSIENRQFITGKDLQSSIVSLPRDEQDVKRLWFLYTKNKAKEVSSITTQTTVSSLSCPDLVEGLISNDEVIQEAKWLSFGGCSLSKMTEYNVLQEGLTVFTVKNAHHLDSLKPLLPRYETNGKHRKEPYYDNVRKEQVAAMPLNDEEAQDLLLTSIKENNDRWAYHEKRKKFYRFKLTHPNKNIYHGFEIEENEISSELIKKLR